MAELKRYFRSVLAETRRHLAPEFAQSLSLQIQNNLLASSISASAASVVLYAPIQNEVDTGLLLSSWLASGKAVFLPRVARDRVSIEIVQVFGPDDLAGSALGIPKPHGEAVTTPLERPVLIVPGGAFSSNGDRIGRGGGHYDRFISQQGPAVRVGLAYSFQLLDDLPRDEWDQRMDFIITETAVHDCRPAREPVRVQAEGDLPRCNWQ